MDDEALVMDMLSSESDAVYSFQGMKRKLGLHQEKLTRILRRLEEDEVVLKTQGGYRVLHRPEKYTHNVAYGEPVIRGQLPPGLDLVVLTSKLKGRWFKNFRWLGYASNETGQSLYWITEDGKFQLRVQLSPSEVMVSSQSTDSNNSDSHVSVGYELFDRISRIIPETAEYS